MADLNRIADRIERWAWEAINETARALSYEPGSNRYYGARKKAEEAEAKLEKALEALRREACGGS
jgi:hypothetical protein